MTMNPMLIPIVGMLIPIILVPVVLGLRHARIDRQFEHAERMRALELGRTLPQDEPWWSPLKVSAVIGAGVPIGVFLAAWMASESMGYHEEVWIMAGLVGVTAVISGTLLAARHLNQRARFEAAARWDAHDTAKLSMDADAFDVVGSRG